MRWAENEKMYSPEFRALMIDGVGRVVQRVQDDMPYIAPVIHEWMIGLSPTDEPADYFMHPAAFPLMLLPYWIERQVAGDADPEFHTDLIFSNACMYYYIRMVDNVMDGHATIEPKLLPATGFFVNQFHTAYHPYFPNDHPFWAFFSLTWGEFCDVTAADGQIADMNEAAFNELIGRKVCAAKIAVAAVLYHYNRAELLLDWSAWIDLFGRWHLFQEDLFDWNQDLELNAATYFLSEARRRKLPHEPEVTWIAREGVDWGMKMLDTWMIQLRKMMFVSDEVTFYLALREQRLQSQRKSIEAALQLILKLAGTSQP